MSDTNFNAEFEKFEFEKQKFYKELSLREKELKLKQKEHGRFGFTSTQVTLLVAILGVVGTITVAYLQSRTNLRLERQKFETELILKTATSDSIEQNKKNLKFFLKAGFITDDDSMVAKLVNDTGFNLQVPQATIMSEDMFMRCKGITTRNKRCKLAAGENGYCRYHINQFAGTP